MTEKEESEIVLNMKVHLEGNGHVDKQGEIMTKVEEENSAQHLWEDYNKNVKERNGYQNL